MKRPAVRRLPGGTDRALEEPVRPECGVGPGSLLAEAGRQAALTEEEWAIFVSRDKAPGRPVSLE